MDNDGSIRASLRCRCERESIDNEIMKRLLYFTGHRLTAFHWDDITAFHLKEKKLASACSFEPDENGFLKFEEYLRSVPNMRVKLLVDVIEEDFRIEEIPHVYGKDKQAVRNRLLDRYYRSSHQFTYSEILGRQKTGRKDDKILLGAITNVNLITPWLEIIDRCETPLSGIWTLPLISKDLLPTMKAKSDAVLLVSQQVSSNLRQTFFKNKKLISSRTSVINQDESQASKLGSHAESEIARTLSYLRGQGHIGAEETVEVHILAPKDQVSSLEGNVVSDARQKRFIHSITNVENDLGISGFDGQLSDGIFASLCVNAHMTKSHYGEAKEFSQFYYSLASSALYAASVLTLIFGVLIAESSIGEAMRYTRSTALYAEQESKFKQTYDTKFKKFEGVLKNAKEMNASVDLVNQIKRGRKINLLDFFIELSRTISDTNVGDISIDSIEWATEQLIARNPGEEPGVVKTNLTQEYPVQHVAVLKGRTSISSDNFRASVKSIDSFVDVLNNNPRIKSVKVIAMPVEIRSEKQFSAESGSQSGARAHDGQQGVFSLEIKMKGQDDA